MAVLTMKSGRINEIQEKNLKIYPFLYFDGVIKVEIDFDLTTRDDIMEDEENNKLIIKTPFRNHFVAYYLTVDKEKINSNIEKRFTYLERSVRDIFWNDIIIEVYINGTIKYKSQKHV